MTEAQLARIEGRLGIKLPKDYRKLMLARSKELKRLKHEINGQLYPWFDESLYLDADEVIRTNLNERPAHAGTGHAFPDWWNTFFLIGSNGAGDYYCLRLNGDSKVWMIGSDCGDKPSERYPSLADYVEKELEEYRQKVEE